MISNFALAEPEHFLFCPVLLLHLEDLSGDFIVLAWPLAVVFFYPSERSSGPPFVGVLLFLSLLPLLLDQTHAAVFVFLGIRWSGAMERWGHCTRFAIAYWDVS